MVGNNNRVINHIEKGAVPENVNPMEEAVRKELPKPVATYDLSTQFGAVRVYKFGEHRTIPIVLLPGRFSGIPIWDLNLPGLIKHRSVYLLDLVPESGASSQTVLKENPEQQAQWLENILVHLGLGEIHLLGISFGGWSAINYANYYPHRMETLILLDPALVFARFSWKIIAFSLMSLLPFMPQAWHEKSLNWLSGCRQMEEDDPMAHLVATGMKDFVVKTPLLAYPDDYELQSIEFPVLVLIAGKSIVHNPKKALARAKKMLLRADVEIWPEASHAMHGVSPEKISKRLNIFFRKWNK